MRMDHGLFSDLIQIFNLAANLLKRDHKARSLSEIFLSIQNYASLHFLKTLLPLLYVSVSFSISLTPLPYYEGVAPSRL